MTAALLIALVAAADTCPPGNTNPNCPNSRQRLQQAQQQQQQAEQQRRQQEQQQRAQEQQREAQQREQQQRAQEQQRETQQREQQQRVQEQQREAQQREQQQRVQEQQREGQQREQMQRQQEQQRAQEQQRGQQQRQQEQQREAQQREQQQREQQQRAQEQQREAQQREQQQRQQEQQRGQQQRDQQLHQQEQQRAQEQQRGQQQRAQEQERERNGVRPGERGGPQVRSQPQPIARPPPRPVQLKNNTTVVARPNQRAVAITRKNPDGSELFVKTHVGQNGVRRVTGYRITKDPVAGTQTRTYLNGSRVITGRDFVTRTTPAGMMVTRHNDGLHECTGRDNKPIYRERYRPYRSPDGREGQAIERTVYVRSWRGRSERLGRPVVEIYNPVYYGGAVVYTYVPTVWTPVFFRPFFIPFVRPIVVVPACIICPTPVVVWEQPVAQYADPVDLVADLQISSAVDDGYYADAPPPQMDPSTVALQQQVSSLQQEVDQEAQTNADLQAQLADQQAQLDGLRAQQEQMQQDGVAPPPPPPPVGDAQPPPPPMEIPEDARQQIRAQVREDISMHQQQQPLSVPGVIASAQAQNYVFQISDPLDVTDASSDEECNLSSGDLVKFAAVPGEQDPVAQMRVVTSRAGSCRAGTTVSVSLTDLQSMLNAFSQRLEQNMNKVHDQVAQAR